MKKLLLFALISLSQFNFCAERNPKSTSKTVQVQEDKIERKAGKNKNNCKKNCKDFSIGFCYGFAIPTICFSLGYILHRCGEFAYGA